jgi:hypothetical protein
MSFFIPVYIMSETQSSESEQSYCGNEVELDASFDSLLPLENTTNLKRTTADACLEQQSLVSKKACSSSNSGQLSMMAFLKKKHRKNPAEC